MKRREIFKRKVLSRIFRPIVENGEYRTRTNDKIYLPGFENPTQKHLSEANEYYGWDIIVWRDNGASKRVLVSRIDDRRRAATPVAKIGGRVESRPPGKGTELEPSANRERWRKIVEAAMTPDGL